MEEMAFYKVISAPNWDFTLVPIIPPTQDWAALYFQLTPAQALGYATDKDSPIINLAKFTWKQPVTIHKLDHPEFGRADVPAAVKAALVRRELKITSTAPLMEALNAALMVLETETDHELIIPHHLVTPEIIQAEILYQFRVNPRTRTLIGFRRPGEEEWQRLTSAEQLNPVKILKRLRIV
jgi:hypothetical protein